MYGEERRGNSVNKQTNKRITWWDVHHHDQVMWQTATTTTFETDKRIESPKKKCKARRSEQDANTSRMKDLAWIFTAENEYIIEKKKASHSVDTSEEIKMKIHPLNECKNLNRDPMNHL